MVYTFSFTMESTATCGFDDKDMIIATTCHTVFSHIATISSYTY